MFIDQGFLIADIIKLLSVSESTIYRRMSQFGISKTFFPEIEDTDVDEHVGGVIKEILFCGENLICQILKQRGIRIQRFTGKYPKIR